MQHNGKCWYTKASSDYGLVDISNGLKATFVAGLCIRTCQHFDFMLLWPNGDFQKLEIQIRALQNIECFFALSENLHELHGNSVKLQGMY